MPQMAPLWWFSLFMMFLCSFLIMVVIMYFQVYNKPNKTIIKEYLNKEVNWKW